MLKFFITRNVTLCEKESYYTAFLGYSKTHFVKVYSKKEKKILKIVYKSSPKKM